MGLDLVELVQMLETEFEFELDPHTAPNIYTVGQLAAQVAKRARYPHTNEALIEQQAFARIAEFIHTEFNVDRSLIHRDARLVDDLGLD
jgi:acyl carrier protein